jgi:uncharacterized Zn finger protein (UPF0148 family)
MGIQRALLGEVHMYEVFAWGTAVRLDPTCPHCRKNINRGVVKCPHCQSDLRAWEEARQKKEENRRLEQTRHKETRLLEEKREEARRLEQLSIAAAAKAERRAERHKAYRAMEIEPGTMAWFKALPDVIQALLMGLAIGFPAAVVILIIVLRSLR